MKPLVSAALILATASAIVGAYYLVSPPAGGRSPFSVDPALEAWNLIKDSRNPEDFDDFVRTFPASGLPAAAVQASIATFTKGGMGTVRIRFSLPTRSTNTQRRRAAG